MSFETKVAEEVKRQLKDTRFQSLERHRNGVGGRVFFVLKTSATNYTQFVEDHPDYKSGDGVVTAAAVYNTVDAAIGACTAAQGDNIFVMPGHTESVTTTSIAMDVSGVTITCLGRGQNQAVFTYTATGSTITVSAANMAWIGGYHVPDTAIACVTAFTIGAAKDFMLQGGQFVDAASTATFSSIVTTGSSNNAADGLTVRDNYVLGLKVSGAAFISILANENRVFVDGNFVDSAATNDIGHFMTLSSKVLLGARITNNTLIVVGATDAAVGVFITGSATTCTGTVAFNKVASLDTTTELLLTATLTFALFENYYTGTVNASGKLWPAVDGA